MLISRRHLIATGTAATLVGLAETARAQTPTSAQELGPFYPVRHEGEVDPDLTRYRGRPAATGVPINIVGRVLDSKGNPVRGARIDVWQANSAGRYWHPGDSANPAPIDPNFQGFAVLWSDRSGRFRFRTIKPGAYPIGQGKWRTPHIHVDVHGRQDRLTTQMYFPGEPLNASDAVLAYADNRETVIARPVDRLSGDPNAAAFAWDIVLAVG